MDKSKIPVPKSQTTNSTEKLFINDQLLPCPKKLCPQKPTVPLYSKDPNIQFSNNPPEFKAASNGKKPVGLKKQSVPTRGVHNRYRMEAEMKDRNHLLEAANTTLHTKLNSAQDTIKSMTEQQKEMEKEIKALNERLEKNLIILENRNIDPVSGESILASAEETNKLKSETKNFTESLLNELQNFSQETNEQRTLLQTVMVKWKTADQERNQFVEEQQAFQKELEQFRECLQQAEQQLNM
ncbi:hypothetical protein GDO86_006432 [Hymenochirus boettgeri]|nr:hypothetical protein GDO86_006432 [Hymenochirus boettgeri]